MDQSKNVVAIDVEKHGANLREAFQVAIRRDPDLIIIIGSHQEFERMVFERMATDIGHAIVVLPAGSTIPADAVEILPLSVPKQSADVYLFDVLLAKVLAGEPIHIQGPMNGANAMMHFATIERLKQVSGKSVSVLYH